MTQNRSLIAVLLVAAALAGVALLLSAIADTEPDPGSIESAGTTFTVAPVTTLETAAGTSQPPTSAAPATTVSTTTTTVDEVLVLVSAMSLEEKVDQLFMVSIAGTDATEPSASDRSSNANRFGLETPAEILAEYELGGVIYFAPNLGDPHQVAGLSNGLQEAAELTDNVGLLIAVDQEGGSVHRLEQGVTVFPSAKVFGRIGDPDLTQRAAQVTATEMRAVGVNHVLAPVVDVVAREDNKVIGNRSFGPDPDGVAALGAATVRGLQRGRVLATAKHFPGHGSTSIDSHVELPVIETGLAEWAASDAVPYRAVIDAGVLVIMTGHLAFPSLDSEGVPATLSMPIVAGTLRDQLGHEGLVMTDALTMGGVRDTASDGEIVVLALEAGVDLLLMPRDFRLARRAVLDAVAGGRLSEAQIDDSVERILRAKQWLGILRPPQVDVSLIDSVVGSPAHLAVRDAVTAAQLALNGDG
jgi:beta-N-acetylhexosaminidase